MAAPEHAAKSVSAKKRDTPADNSLRWLLW